MFKSKKKAIETIFKEGEFKAYSQGIFGDTTEEDAVSGIIYENKDLGLSIAVSHYHSTSKNRALVKKLANQAINELIGKWE